MNIEYSPISTKGCSHQPNANRNPQSGLRVKRGTLSEQFANWGEAASAENQVCFTKTKGRTLFIEKFLL